MADWLKMGIVAAVVLTGAGAGAAAAAAEERAAMPQSVLLTEQNNNQTVAVQVGQPVVVSLPENASTGYRWAVAELDSRFLAVHEGQPHYPSQALGAGGRAEWNVVPSTAGETALTLKLWRSWEGDSSIIQRFHIRFRIHP